MVGVRWEGCRWVCCKVERAKKLGAGGRDGLDGF